MVYENECYLGCHDLPGNGNTACTIDSIELGGSFNRIVLGRSLNAVRSWLSNVDGCCHFDVLERTTRIDGNGGNS